MNNFSINEVVRKFPGPNGWYYVPLSDELSADLRPLMKNRWPALLNAQFKLNNTEWKSSIMPIKDGPLFIALPAKVRKAENIVEGSNITINFKLTI